MTYTRISIIEIAHIRIYVIRQLMISTDSAQSRGSGERGCRVSRGDYHRSRVMLDSWFIWRFRLVRMQVMGAGRVTRSSFYYNSMVRVVTRGKGVSM